MYHCSIISRWNGPSNIQNLHRYQQVILTGDNLLDVFMAKAKIGVSQNLLN